MHYRYIRAAKKVGFFCIILLISSIQATAQNAERIAVPADLIQELSLPGLNHFLRPGQVYFDHHAAELYIVDQGHNRIIIFDGDGTYRFDFSVEAHCGSVRDLAVNSAGTVLLLGSTKSGIALLKFDFDGLFLGRVDLDLGDVDTELRLTTITIDDSDQVYILDESVPRIVILSPEFEYRSDFRILDSTDDKTVEEAVFGFLRYHDGELWLPVSSLGGVYRYGTDGDFRGVFGRPGTKVGELNFPSAVSFISDDMVLVLDKKRFAVLCHDRNGRFLGEFGGMGMNPGWFYYPTWMAVDADGRVYISQVFMNRVQMCRIPDRIQSQVSDEEQFGSLPD